MAAATADRAIPSEGGGFEEIVFAIPGSGRRSTTNLEAYRSVFQD